MNISFVQTSISIVEGVGVIELVLRKSPGGIGPVSVDLRTHDGTATGMSQSESRLFHLTRTLIIDTLLPLFLSFFLSLPVRDDYQLVDKRIEFDANTTLGIDELEKREIIIITDNTALEEREFFTVSITAVLGIFPVAVQNFTAIIEIDDNDGK